MFKIEVKVLCTKTLFRNFPNSINFKTLVKAQTAIFKSENELWAPFKDGLLELQKKSAKITYNLRLTKFTKNNVLINNLLA